MKEKKNEKVLAVGILEDLEVIALLPEGLYSGL